ncbi:MAG: ShlB/FhaC/HecB family hemolysin secretion/activation protein [Gammaproteobacteria bacterium]
MGFNPFFKSIFTALLLLHMCALQAENTEYALPTIKVEPDKAEPQSQAEAPAESPIADQPVETGYLFVSRIELQDSTVLSDEEVRRVVGPYENKRITSQELQVIRAELTQLYIDKGYISSGVVLPRQTVSEGKVVFQAVEGQLVRIEIEGDPSIRDGYVSKRVQRNLQGATNLKDIQYALNMLQTDQNVARLDARLEPGENPGEGVLKVSVEEPKKFSAFTSFDNYRSPVVGTNRGSLGVQARNLTGFGDLLSATGSITDGTDEWSVFYTLPFTANDNLLDLYYQRSNSEVVEGAVEDLDIENETDTAGIRITHPFISTLEHEFSMSLGFEYKKNQSQLLGFDFSLSPGAQDGETKTATPQLGANYINRGDSHVFTLSGLYSRGIDALDATIFEPENELDKLRNPTGADGEFDLFFVQAFYLKRLNSLGLFEGLSDRAQFELGGRLQWTDDSLLSLQKASIGGRYTVRGYQESLLNRDRGGSVTAELQFPVPGYIPDPNVRNLVIAPFIDLGWAQDSEDIDPNSTVRDTSDSRYILGAGLGLIWQPFKGFYSEVYWGADLADNFDDDDPRDFQTRDDELQDDGIYFQFRYDFPSFW